MKKNRYIYGSLMIVLLAVSVLSAQTIYVFLAVALVITTAISTLLNLIALHYINGRIEISAIGEKNIQLQGEVIIDNPRRLWLPEVICDMKIENLLTGEEIFYTYKTPLGIRKKSRIPIVFSSKYCGCLEMSIEKIGVSDIWGVTVLRKKGMEKSVVNIMPDTFKQEIVLTNKNDLDSCDSDFYHEKIGNVSGEIYDIKEYEEGDNIKNIHWKLTGKYDNFMVKRLSMELENSILLLLETGYANIEKKAGGEIMDSLAEVFMSLSQNLMNNGIRHKIGWQEQTSGNFLLYDVTTENDVVGILPRILAAKYSEDTKSVMEHYFDTFGLCEYSHVVCVAPDNHKPFHTGFVEKNVYVTALLGTKHTSELIQAEDITEIKFAPGDYREKLSYLTI